MYTLDTGHYEQTENVADIIPSLLLFVPELMLHVSRPMHWDSDHVTLYDDRTQDLFKEIVRAGALDRAHIGLDYFDASINRIAAYVIGVRAAQKSLLQAMLEPHDTLCGYEDRGEGYKRLGLMEEMKSMPFGAVYDYFNMVHGAPVGEEYFAKVDEYEKNVTLKRG
jgi:L-rhamnose isomerase